MVQGEEEQRLEGDPCHHLPGADLCQLHLGTARRSVPELHPLQGEGCPLRQTGQILLQQDLKIHLQGILSMEELNVLLIEEQIQVLPTKTDPSMIPDKAGI